MTLEINPRGNGACPLCAADGDCRLQKLLGQSIAGVPDGEEPGMEIVVYSCSYFKESD
ncbi:MAG TPA: hypothetical protein VMV90_00860 [Rectinemataceae bacterium]|nr:hypothetical protein [Rectinemataceae bacterium]